MRPLKIIIFFIICFLYVFGPVFRPVGAWMDLIFLTSFMLSWYGKIILNIKFPKYLKNFYSLFFVFIYAFISIIIYGNFEIEEVVRFILIPIRIFITLFGGFTLVFIIRKHYENYFYVTIQIIYFAVVCHALIMIAQLYSPAFKDLLYLYTSTGEFRGTYDYNFRMGGLSGGTGGSVLSVVQSLGIIVIPMLFKNSTMKWKLPLMFGGLVIFFSILICGRSGIWSALIFLPISVYFTSETKNFKFFIKYAFALVIILILFLGTFFLFDSVEIESPIYYSLRRSLDTFLSFEETGEFNDRTFEVLSTHLLLPDNFNTLIFGNAEHLVNNQFSRTLNSDIGYIRNIWGFGIIFAFLFWLPILYFVKLSNKLKYKYQSAVLLFSLSLIMLFFQAKENFLYVRMFFSIYSLILSCLYFERFNFNKEN